MCILLLGTALHVLHLDVFLNILLQGCADVVIDGVRGNLAAIAGGAIVLGLTQVHVHVDDVRYIYGSISQPNPNMVNTL